MKITDLPSLFFGQRRAAIRYIVVHTSEGTDSRDWLTRTGGVSAHYLVRRQDVYRLVGEDWTAWHAGEIVGTPTTPLWGGGNPNEESIGIEMEGYAAQPVRSDTLHSTAELIREIRSRRGPLPLVNHSELSPGSRTDPGTGNRATLDVLLEEEGMDTDELRKIIREEIAAYAAEARRTGFEPIKKDLAMVDDRVDAVQRRLLDAAAALAGPA